MPASPPPSLTLELKCILKMFAFDIIAEEIVINEATHTGKGDATAFDSKFPI